MGVGNRKCGQPCRQVLIVDFFFVEGFCGNTLKTLWTCLNGRARTTTSLFVSRNTCLTVAGEKKYMRLAFIYRLGSRRRFSVMVITVYTWTTLYWKGHLHAVRRSITSLFARMVRGKERRSRLSV